MSDGNRHADETGCEECNGISSHSYKCSQRPKSTRPIDAEFLAEIDRDYSPCRHDGEHRAGTRCDVNRLRAIVTDRDAQLAAAEQALREYRDGFIDKTATKMLGKLQDRAEAAESQLAAVRTTFQVLYGGNHLVSCPEDGEGNGCVCGFTAFRQALVDPPRVAGAMDDLQQRVGAWAAATFPNSTLHAKVAHLRREVEELASSGAAEEIADCILILLHVADAAGVSAHQACEAKFAVCLTRQWGAPDADGVVEHVRSPRVAPVDRLTEIEFFNAWRDYIDHSDRCHADQAAWWNNTPSDEIIRTRIPCSCGLKDKLDKLGRPEPEGHA